MKKLILTLTFTSAISFAQTSEPPPPFSHESELGVVTTSGNSKSESYSVKQITTKRWGSDSLSLTGRYLETKAESEVTAKSWDAGLRYEKSISDLWAGFLTHKAESDQFAGFIQRDSTDLGAKYSILSTDVLKWFAELGLSYLNTYTTAREHEYDPSSRLYTEVTQELQNNISLKYWVEYVQSITHSKTYFVNTEASVHVMLNDQLSLKTAYLLKYHNRLSAPDEDYSDSTFITSLVAKF